MPRRAQRQTPTPTPTREDVTGTPISRSGGSAKKTKKGASSSSTARGGGEETKTRSGEDEEDAAALAEAAASAERVATLLRIEEEAEASVRACFVTYDAFVERFFDARVWAGSGASQGAERGWRERGWLGLLSLATKLSAPCPRRRTHAHVPARVAERRKRGLFSASECLFVIVDVAKRQDASRVEGETLDSVRLIPPPLLRFPCFPSGINGSRSVARCSTPL